MNGISRIVTFLVLMTIVTTMGAQAQKPQPKSSTQSIPAQGASAQNNSSTIVLPVFGSGATSFIPLWTGRQVIGNSILSQVPGGLNVAGSVTGTSFFGDGSHVVNVNALTLQGLSPSAFVQTNGSNTFTGDQTINGNLNLTGYINKSLLLQGNLTDPLGEESANIIGGYGGDPTGAYPGNSVGAGVIGATIAGGGGAYDSGSLPPNALPQIKHGANSNIRSAPGQTLQSKRRRQPPQSQQANGAPPPAGIVSGSNIVQQAANWATVGGGLHNTAGGFASTVAGGFGNTTSGNYATIGGGDVNTVSGDEGTVSGGTFNLVSGSETYIGGGYQNSATGQYDVVVGGNQNSAGLLLSTVAGGGAYSDDFDQIYYSGNQAAWIGDTVSGGRGNIANSNDWTTSAACPFLQICSAVVAGGDANSALESGAVVSGGYGNLASAPDSTVPGGVGNKAAGYGSFAAGVGAVANYNGSFVWNPTGDVVHILPNILQVQDSAPQQFVAGAPGGVVFDTGFSSTGAPIVGALLPAGSGSWVSFSDRNVKDNFAGVDRDALLSKIVALPISTWNYKTEDPSMRHMGPTAQDFRAAFALGEDDKHIANIDSEGVALAGIQALYKLVQDKDAKIDCLEQQLKAVRQEKDAQITELSRKLDEKLQSVNLLEERLSRIESSLLRTASSSDTQPQMTVLRAEPTQGQ